MIVETDDTALVVLLQNKVTRHEAFKLVLNKYQQKLYYFLRRMGLDHEDADESLQDIFIEFWKTLNTRQADEALNITLYRLGAKSCLSYLQKCTIKTLRELTAEQQLCIVLKEQEEFDFREIAQIMSMPVNRIRHRFYTAIGEIYQQQTIKK